MPIYIEPPTLERSAYPRAAYPRPTLERKCLPWSYPGAQKPAPPRLQGRLPLRTWPFGDFPLPLPPLPPARPPRAPTPQGLPKTPRPPPTLELALDPGRAPQGPCDQAGDLGSRMWARGPIHIFRKINLYGKPAKSTHGRAGRRRPTLELP